MTLHRFFVPPAEATGERFPIPPSVERQIRTVLRLRSGERVALLTGDGAVALCRLEGGECIVEERGPAMGEPRHRLTIVQALLKGDALEQVVQHATEVGVAEFRLVVSERSIARDLSPHRLQRLRAIAREAAEQSERGVVPAVHEPVPLAAAIAPGSALLLERHAGVRLGAIEAPSGVVIGPEGGFTSGEVAEATRRGAVLAGLGPLILRSETVAVAAAAAILSRTGDFA